MDTAPLISVICPCYQAEQHIAATVRSVLRQTEKAWELVIVDDGSTDNTVEVARSASEGDLRVRIASFPNRGVCTARNRGARLSSGLFLVFLDADDLLDDDMLLELSRYLLTRPSVGMVHCANDFIDSTGQVIMRGDDRLGRLRATRYGLVQLRPDDPITPLESLVIPTWLTPSMAMLRRDIFEASGEWNESLASHADNDMWVRMALKAEVHYVPSHFTRYRRHGTQMSAASHDGERSEMFRQWRTLARQPTREGIALREALRFRDRRAALWLAMMRTPGMLAASDARACVRTWLGALRLLLLSVLSPAR
jgi:glycosyltransferase involved in cell wall biosynthesis